MLDISGYIWERVKLTTNWGKPERAPHRRVCCGISLYIIYHMSCRKSLPALILRVLVSFVNSKTIHQWPTTCTQREGTNHHTSSMATVRMETTHGPTYSMTRVIGATPWRKGSSLDAIVCIATIAHSQWKSLITWTDLSNGHIDEHVGEIKSATSV